MDKFRIQLMKCGNGKRIHKYITTSLLIAVTSSIICMTVNAISYAPRMEVLPATEVVIVPFLEQT
jgi:hypothetical protein